MGNLMKSLMKDLDQTSDQLKEEIQQNLKNAEELGKVKLEGFKKTIELDVNNDKVLPVVDKVNEHEEIQAFYSKTNDSIKGIVKNVSDLVTTIVNISQDTSKTKEQSTADTAAIKNNAQTTIDSVVDALLGVGQGASYERKEYSVFFVNNSMIKLNWAVYFYNIIASKLDGEQKAMVSVLYFRVDVLDLLGSKSELLIYEASKHFGVESAKEGIIDTIELLVEIEEKKRKLTFHQNHDNEKEKNKRTKTENVLD